ncbi:MAG: hypothetical protein M3395_01450 [Chloroflexota bacterium]|nr:hypothetical protein [Chloroflexota bacterium]
MPRHVQAPFGADHDDHDRLLMVRLAADDLSRDERPAAESVRTSCAQCAALADDVRRISLATARLPVPRRPRDFRLTATQARQARGSILRRLMERLSAPGLGVLQPLGAAAVAIGFVLVVVGMGLPAMGGASPQALDYDVHSANASPASASSPDAAVPDDGADDRGTAAPAAGAESDGFGGGPPTREEPSSRTHISGGGVEAPAGNDEPAGTADLESTARPEPAASDSASEPTLVTGGQAEPAASAAPREDTVVEAGDPEHLAQAQTGTPAGAGLVTLGLLLGLSGLLVLTLRVLSVRMGRDPAIR